MDEPKEKSTAPETEEANALDLWSPGLFSKFGFCDGDQLYEWKEKHLKPRKEVNSAKLLVAAVRAYLLPALKQKVEVEIFETIHNPIRAVAVDGVEVDWDLEEDPFEDGQGERFALEPEIVRVTDQQLAALFPDLLSSEENTCNNKLMVSGPQEGIERFWQQFYEHGFAGVIPEPEDEFPNKDWYGWRWANWGTGWNVGESDFYEDMDREDAEGVATVRFSTACEPPIAWLKASGLIFPDLKFTLVYLAAGAKLGGITDVQGELLTDDRCRTTLDFLHFLAIHDPILLSALDAEMVRGECGEAFAREYCG